MTPHPDAVRFQRFDNLPADERTALLGHVRECADCRRRLAGGDPSRLFALLALETPPAAALNRLSAGLNRELDRVARSRSGPGRLRSAASIAAALVLAAFLGSYALRQSAPGRAVAADVRPSGDAATLAAYEAPAPAEGVELLSTPGQAQVMELAIGDTQVVMIFDEALDI
jgi:hypothetical protein